METAPQTNAGERLPLLVRHLLSPEAYPHRPDHVEFKQTHISYVLLAGDYVYKLKKPVKFSFLDYSTFARRAHFCSEEVRLNRRLAPAVYLGVVPVIDRRSRFIVAEDMAVSGRWVAHEYAVKMRRLPEDRMLDHLLKTGQVETQTVRAIARKLASFHQTAATDKAVQYGKPASIAQAVQDNFQETATYIGQTIGQQMFETLRNYQQQFLAEHQALLLRRVANGWVCEGHGDLRAEHICLDAQLNIFDCIEFNPGLRYCDVVSEVAFLAMDLDFLGASDLAAELVEAYTAAQRPDTAFSVLLPFYQSYRAYVRGKVESLTSQEDAVPVAQRVRARLHARRYFCLATRYALGPSPPALLVVCGLSGSGKSTLADLLGQRTGFRLLNADPVRKTLANIPPTTRAAAVNKDIYTPQFTQRTYQTLRDTAANQLAQSHGVIIDATCTEPSQRQLFLDVAAQTQVPLLFVECQAEEEEIARRLRVRTHRQEASADASDATWEVYLQQRKHATPFSDLPDHVHTVVSTDTALEHGLAKVEDFVCR